VPDYILEFHHSNVSISVSRPGSIGAAHANGEQLPAGAPVAAAHDGAVMFMITG